MTLAFSVSFTLRILLAFIFLCGAWHKISNTHQFVAQFHAYRLLPEPVLPAVTYALILIEVYLAVSLPILGWLSSSFIAATLLTLYALAMAINLVRGRFYLDCGCGGPAKFSQPISWALVIRNGVLAIIAVVTTLPLAARALSPLDFSTMGLASTAAILMYCSIEQAILNRQREQHYLAQRTSTPVEALS